MLVSDDESSVTHGKSHNGVFIKRFFVAIFSVCDWSLQVLSGSRPDLISYKYLGWIYIFNEHILNNLFESPIASGHCGIILGYGHSLQCTHL